MEEKAEVGVTSQRTVCRPWSLSPPQVDKYIYQFVPCREHLLVLFREVITFDFKHHKKHVITLCNKIHCCQS